MKNQAISQSIPLPEQMRPVGKNDLVGQEHFWEEGSVLRELVGQDRFYGLIFWGPPGTGKTSLAQIIGREGSRQLHALSAVSCGVKEIRAVIEDSIAGRNLGNPIHLLFMDEIHRLNKSQQDVLLPALELAQIKLIGATTENPSFEVNKAVLSRCMVFNFKPLTTEKLTLLVARTLSRTDSKPLTKEAIARVAQAADGDARRCLNILDALLAANLKNEKDKIDEDDFEKLPFDFVTRYDRKGDQHYDIASAMIKSIRGSHPDAAIYYLARMIAAGEDPMFIARRLVISASEDIGNANPTALLIATNAMQAAQMVGFPEARIILSQAVTYLAASPKSNRAYQAIDAALSDVKAQGSLEVPLHLRNGVTNLMTEHGYGKNYRYAHEDLEGARAMTYLPEPLKGRRYYHPTAAGAEAQLAKNLERLRPHAD